MAWLFLPEVELSSAGNRLDQQVILGLFPTHLLV
ncbi:hypothetical protein ACVW0Q_001522 [Thermostichus sp. MS-CIW-21]|nr:hypothetical protein SYN63AY4M2_02460 [Synechococcus sp. 63AY4M2]PIK89741.1 hypothetical protein SYN65AY6A5_06205 [Synechococcus sp. 65AY6A5]PIK90000.1 hypothetical protein SYN65AY6LI_13700 [Synechococcus sp. 65AY6Li]PIK96381.1 hypothetical protein SYN60AY4M2_02925 [Synechococcus sp. 60AY4M2]PIK98977.1 hypothetical protein SYN63AY4M1_00410 [Synechococcus sp. 63AY4M1]PIL02337.1 hypothetical protein SYN65AY640_00240 [Synechococcus sp. 65AY640]